jgi:hypothetical protein
MRRRPATGVHHIRRGRIGADGIEYEERYLLD